MKLSTLGPQRCPLYIFCITKSPNQTTSRLLLHGQDAQIPGMRSKYRFVNLNLSNRGSILSSATLLITSTHPNTFDGTYHSRSDGTQHVGARSLEERSDTFVLEDLRETVSGTLVHPLLLGLLGLHLQTSSDLGGMQIERIIHKSNVRCVVCRRQTHCGQRSLWRADTPLQRAETIFRLNTAYIQT